VHAVGTAPSPLARLQAQRRSCNPPAQALSKVRAKQLTSTAPAGSCHSETHTWGTPHTVNGHSCRAAPAAGSWRDPDAPLAGRVDDLLGRLTLEEKVEQLSAARDAVGAVKRLGVPAFQGWNGAPPAAPRTASFLSKCYG